VSEFTTIVYEKKNTIAYITLNRPEVLNVYNIKMRDELYQVLSAVKDDYEIKAAVVKGAGEKAFCAGADLSEFLSAPSPLIARKVRWERDIWGVFLSLPMPIIAVLHGYVLGSGLEMALCCDLRIASEDAKFGLPECRLGIIPAAGATQTLSRRIGTGKALEMMLTGRWINAREAYEVKLINQIVDREKLLEVAENTAKKISQSNPIAVRNAKQALIRGINLPLAAGLEMESRLSTLARNSLKYDN